MNAAASALALLLVLGCRSNDGVPPPAATPAAQVDDGRVTVRPDAAAHLGLATALVEPAPRARPRTLGGDVVVPLVVADGTTIVVAWPLATADRLRAAESLAVAEGDRARATTERDAADAALARARQLLTDRAGSVRGVEEARARAEVAHQAVLVAERRVALVRGILGHAPGEVWVRVPVYAGERAVLERAGAVRVGHLGRDDPQTSSARRIDGPASADPTTATVDLFLALAEHAGFTPGEKVTATFEVPEKPDALVIPWSAVVLDATGAAWAYEEVAPDTYARRRVVVGEVTPPVAIVTGALAPGTRIVTTGAAELLGVELGNGT